MTPPRGLRDPDQLWRLRLQRVGGPFGGNRNGDKSMTASTRSVSSEFPVDLKPGIERTRGSDPSRYPPRPHRGGLPPPRARILYYTILYYTILYYTILY